MRWHLNLMRTFTATNHKVRPLKWTTTRSIFHLHLGSVWMDLIETDTVVIVLHCSFVEDTKLYCGIKKLHCCHYNCQLLGRAERGYRIQTLLHSCQGYKNTLL